MTDIRSRTETYRDCPAGRGECECKPGSVSEAHCLLAQDEEDELLGAAKALGIDLSPGALRKSDPDGHNWFSDDLRPRTHELTRRCGPYAKNLWVAHPEHFRPNEIVRFVSTGEAAKVLQVTNRVVVKRGIGAMKPQAAEKGELVVIVGSAA